MPQAAIQDAEEVCEVTNASTMENGSNSGDSSGTNGSGQCAAAWDEAEELQAELARQKMKYKDY